MNIIDIYKKKENKSKMILLFVMLALLFILFYFWETKNKNNLETDKIIDVYFLKLNEADSNIIKYKNKLIIIDTGEEKHKNIIQTKLEQLKISKIDYMILSHPDKDHIGSAKYLIEKFEVENIIQSHFKKGSNLQKELDKVIADSNVNNIILNETKEITIDDLKFTLIPGNEETYKEDNDYSLVALMHYFNNNFFFGADIEETRIEEVLKLNLTNYDVVKIPHHGRYNPLSISLLELLKPKYAIITAGSTDNRILAKLGDLNTDFHFTKNYEINIKCDGNNFVLERID